MQNKNKILILDIETTDTNEKKGHIIEIGIVQLDLTNNRKTTLFNNVCWETGITKKEVEESWILANSSLTVKAVQESKNLDKYKPNIQRIIDEHPCGITAFNSSFDFRWFDSRGIHIIHKLPCLMKVAKPVVKALNKKGNLKNPNVEEAYRYLVGQKEYKEEHRAAADAWDEADIAFMLHKQGKFIVPKYSILTK